MKKQLAISLNSTKVERLEIKKVDIDDVLDSMELSFSVDYPKDNLESFNLIFKLKLPHRSGLIFDVEYIAFFITDHKIDTEFKNSFFPVINAPAIAYPFLRAYISTLMTISGYDPIILPTINFSEALENSNYKEE